MHDPKPGTGSFGTLGFSTSQNDAKNVLEMKNIHNNEIQSKSTRIISNPILESYAELKAWTNATDSSLGQIKVCNYSKYTN